MKLNRGPQRESGVILIMVLMISLLMSIFVIGIISTSVSGVISAEHQVDRMKAEATARATDALAYYRHFNNDFTTVNTLSLPMDSKTFSATASAGSSGTGPNGTTPYSSTVNY